MSVETTGPGPGGRSGRRFRPGPVAVGLLFLAHPLEEASTDFPLWFRSHLGGGLDPAMFVVISLVGLAFVTLTVGAHRRGPPRPALLAMVGALLLINAGLHIGAAFLTVAYVPGLLTAVLIWAPLGLLILREAGEPGHAPVLRGVVGGVLLQGLATGVALLA